MSEEMSGGEAAVETSAPTEGGADTSVEATPGGGGETGGSAEPNPFDWSQKVTTKVDGEERELTLAELRDGYSLSSASHKRFQEASNLTRRADERAGQVQQVLQIMQDGPPDAVVAALQAIDVDPAQFIQRLTQWQQQQAQITPEQRRQMELERREAEFNKQRQEWDQKRKSEQQAAQAQAVQDQMVQDWTAKALEMGLSDAKAMRLIERAAEIGLEFLDAGQPLDTDTILRLADEGAKADVQSALRGMQPADLARYLGDEQVKALQEYSLQQIRENGAQPPAVAPVQARNSESARRRQESRTTVWDDF